MSLVLSLFPGIGLLDRAFEEEGFCVVRGPDLLWGGDIKTFHPPAGVFDGVIGGPPCQIHSRMRALQQPRHGDMIPEFRRVVEEARPDWWLMENVTSAYDPAPHEYRTSTLSLDNRWIGDGVGQTQSRRRRFWFGTADGRQLAITEFAVLENPIRKLTVLAGHGAALGQRRSIATYSIPEMLELQGFPGDLLDSAPFTVHGKRQVVGNGVPLTMGRAIAKAVRRALEEQA